MLHISKPCIVTSIKLNLLRPSEPLQQANAISPTGAEAWLPDVRMLRSTPMAGGHIKGCHAALITRQCGHITPKETGFFIGIWNWREQHYSLGLLGKACAVCIQSNAYQGSVSSSCSFSCMTQPRLQKQSTVNFIYSSTTTFPTLVM